MDDKIKKAFDKADEYINRDICRRIGVPESMHKEIGIIADKMIIDGFGEDVPKGISDWLKDH